MVLINFETSLWSWMRSACLGVALFLEELNDKSLWIPDYSPQVKGKNQRKVQK